MNGRCHKDALDRAEDICELCGEQFCASCLVFPRGHRNPPTCKGCALAHSGLRGTGSAKNPISRREYKKRKKALLAQLDGVEEEAPAIEYFELADPSTFDTSSELDRRPPPVDEPERVDLAARLDDTTPATPPPPPSPAAAPTPPPPAPPPPTASAPTSLTTPSSHAEDQPPAVDSSQIEGFEPVDTTINPLAIESPAPSSRPESTSPGPASEASTSAADLLARLKADQPIQSQYTSTPHSASPHSLDVDPFAPPTAPSNGAPSAAANNGSRAADRAAPGTEPSALATDPFAAPPGSSPGAGSPTAAMPAHGRPKTEPWQPPAIPPRGSNLDSMTGGEPSGPSTAEAPVPARQPIPGPEDADDAQPPTRADTDDSGQWIPPSLRGIAPPDVRAADPLPRRR